MNVLFFISIKTQLYFNEKHLREVLNLINRGLTQNKNLLILFRDSEQSVKYVGLSYRMYVQNV